ncbi:hypothetical protein [Actinoallomurus iriomotensis]|uniref:Uncharacterized protein n=1 Tax=Actinoallomurus iriomotensis TaxID=478107 RepID=A0A9W6RPZ6_9ACTN|nr:hypothetical protein [Actinoallomurus iriomotensis]GLY79729.1 hypothetical protein Airi01_079960 [Actinoallomurus iriomotensis]
MNAHDDLTSGSPMRKKPMALTERERQILLAELSELADELTEIATQLEALHKRTSQIIDRVAPRSSVRLVRPA